jgi:hypothetical protein
MENSNAYANYRPSWTVTRLILTRATGTLRPRN